MRVPFERRDELPEHPRVIYPPILDITHFHHFLSLLENHNPMDEEPILNETTQEALNVADGGILLYKTPNQAYQLLEDKVLLKLDWANNQKPKPYLKKIIAFAYEGSSCVDTNNIMARMDAMTLNMDDQYKEMKSCNECNRCGGNHSISDCNDDDTPITHEEEAKFMRTFRQTIMDLKTTTKNHQASIQYLEAKFDRLADKQSARPSGSLPSNTQPKPREDLALCDNKSWNDPRDFAKPVKEISLPQDVPSTSDRRLVKLENQVQCLMEGHLAPKQPLQVNKITSLREICSGPHDTQYCIENPEQAFVDYASLRTDKAGEQNRNLSSPKRVHFVNPIVILNKEYKAKESAKSSATEYKDHEMIVIRKEEFEDETDEETKKEEEDNPKHFNVFPTMKELGLHYNWIMSSRLEPRRKPSNPKKICNFVGRVRGLKVFIGNFTYECDFMVLEDTTNVIDHDLRLVVFRKPFVEATGLVYDMKEGTVMFEKDKEKTVFKMPHKMEIFKHIDFTNIKTDHIPRFVIESDDDNSKKMYVEPFEAW
nr:reverse transcriptase domain-containing protein [Tanacetum cinerariifolium]